MWFWLPDWLICVCQEINIWLENELLFTSGVLRTGENDKVYMNKVFGNDSGIAYMFWGVCSSKIYKKHHVPFEVSQNVENRLYMWKR